MDLMDSNPYEKYSLKKFSANIFRVNKIDFILDKRYAP